jgi:poly-gamma-glutamate synthesis protein (capsule biosynthesis protein)
LKIALVGAATSGLLLGACGLASGGGGGGASSDDPKPGETGRSGEVDNGEEGAAPTTAPFVPRTFTIGASGDILVHAPVMRSGMANGGGKVYDFNPMFDDVRPMISAADVSICHQETPISADGKNLTVPNTLSFNAPREIAPALAKAGFDGCDTASNHTWDRLLPGVKQTNQVLAEAGLKYVGGAGSPEEMTAWPIYEVKGVKVGHLAYSYTIFNNAGPNTQVPPEAPWLKGMLWPAIGKEGILADAAKLKAKGAEFVVVSIHWGDQYVHQPNLQQAILASDVLASPDVDLILGDHVHVIQPCEKLHGKYVIYGLGNFLSNQAPGQAAGLLPDNQDGVFVQFDVTETAPGKFTTNKMTFSPTFVQTQGHKILRATPDKYKPSYDRTTKWMHSLGPGKCDAVPAY